MIFFSYLFGTVLFVGVVKVRFSCHVQTKKGLFLKLFKVDFIFHDKVGGTFEKQK